MKLSNRVRNIAACLIVGAVLLLAVGNLAYDYVYQQGSNAGSSFGYLAGQKATLHLFSLSDLMFNLLSVPRFFNGSAACVSLDSAR